MLVSKMLPLGNRLATRSVAESFPVWEQATRQRLVRSTAGREPFLAGPRASFVTGEDIRVDGGLLATVAVALTE